YFLEIAREGNISRAAEYLHVSQPTLSKQMKELEAELGQQLYTRGSRSIKLTDEGMLLRKRTEDILSMVDKTMDEFKSLADVSGGEVRIGCAESYQIRYIAQVIKNFQARYPRFLYHISSGNTEIVTERLDKGLLDFAVIVEPPDLSKYNYLTIPESDVWGVVMRRDHPLTEKDVLYIDDLAGISLLCSEQAMQEDLPRWCGEKMDLLNITGTFNLTYNGSVFVKEGLGCLLTFNHLANTSKENDLCFRPLKPALNTQMYIIWKKYQIFTPIGDLLKKEFETTFGK
ncbi:MAG: LysR family transcriptional regulator, partial [Lachnospiraceae bacterium]|nr:LysR family transcriptional regulator [Lachnospiraceae bacterium]